MDHQLADRIPNRVDANIIAVYCDYDGDHTQPYTFFLGCAVTNSNTIPDGFTTRTISTGQYHRRRANGTMPAALMAAWSDLWTSDLNRSYKTDFEIHDLASPNSVDIYVGVA